MQVQCCPPLRGGQPANFPQSLKEAGYSCLLHWKEWGQLSNAGQPCRFENCKRFQGQWLPTLIHVCIWGSRRADPECFDSGLTAFDFLFPSIFPSISPPAKSAGSQDLRFEEHQYPRIVSTPSMPPNIPDDITLGFSTLKLEPDSPPTEAQHTVIDAVSYVDEDGRTYQGWMAGGERCGRCHVEPLTLELRADQDEKNTCCRMMVKSKIVKTSNTRVLC